MKIFKGITASPGIAQGPSCMYSERIEETIPHYVIDRERVPDEIKRMEEAYAKARTTMGEVLAVSEKMFGKAGDEIFKAHMVILEDRVLRESAVKLIEEKNINAEHAVNDVFEGYIKQLQGKDSHFSEIAHDIIDVRDRILSSFSGSSGRFECPMGERQPVVVVSRRLTPSMIMKIPREHVLAFVTEEGGFTTHATILARNYGVPVIFGVDVENNVDCGAQVIVDGGLGKVIVDPDKKTDEIYSKKIEGLLRKKAVCAAHSEKPARTQKKTRVLLKVNISDPGEMELLKDVHYDGVGLLRSEFVLGDRSRPPEENEWVKAYRDVLERAEGRPVVIRLLDIGGDKMPEYLSLPDQENPDLGIRGARALELFADVYLRQIRAILRCSVFGDLRILYPMVSDVGDIESYRSILRKAESQLSGEKIPFKKGIQEGVMIETPSAAIMADRLLETVDFANIGSNDLIQYTLAASRGNQLIEKRYHIVHPSLVRLMEIVAKEGKKAGKEICLCGEIASFEEYHSLFLGIGLYSFSVAPARLEDIKCHLMHTKRTDKNFVRRFYKSGTKDELDALFNGEKGQPVS